MTDEAPTTTEGWLAFDKQATDGQMQWQEFPLRPFETTDVDIEVSHCGVCGSDIHAMQDSWVRD